MIKVFRFNPFLFPAFCSLLLLFCPLALSAQEPPVSVSFTPPDGWEEGDEVEMIIEYGSEEIPGKNVTDVQFEIEMPEGTSVSNTSSLEVTADNSWFGFDHEWFGSAEFTNEGYSVLVSLSRSNGSPVSGYGEVARVKGLVMEIDEIIWKTEVKGNIKVTFDRSKEITTLFYSPDLDRVLGTGFPSGTELQLLDMNGRTIASGDLENGIDVSVFTPQLYFVKAFVGTQFLDAKMIFIQ